MAANSENRPSQGSDLPGDVVEDIRSSERRRRMLSCLADSDGPMIVEELARAVCAAESGDSPDSIDPERCRAVRTEIYDRHLPKLTATGVVEYDSMRETIRLVDEGLAEEE